MQKTTATSPIDSFVLKIIAIVAMTANHTAHAFMHMMSLDMYVVLTGIGGLTFPIMAYLMLIGYNHTRNVWKYMGRLLVFAIIAQIPYMFLYGRPNVLFTLLVGLFLYWLYDNSPSRILFWFIALSSAVLTAAFDWGLFGPLCMILLKVLEKYNKAIAILLPIGLIGVIHMLAGLGDATTLTPGGLTTIGSGAVALVGALTGQGLQFVGNLGGLGTLAYGAMNIVSAFLLMGYNGQRGYPMKYFFYVYYPLHLTILAGAAYMCGLL